MYKSLDYLIINDSDKNITKMLFIIPVIISIFVYLGFNINLNVFFLNICLKSIVFILTIFFVIGFIFAIYLKYNKKPLAVLNSDGINFRYYGFIDWNNIKSVNLMHYPLSINSNVIEIWPKDLYVFSNSKMSFIGKIGFFWSKIFNYCPIILSNIDKSGIDIINFAQRYLDKN